MGVIVTHKMVAKGGEDYGAGMMIGMLCGVCCLLAPGLMWLIWGSIITNNADAWKDSSACRAEEFWWMQVSAYISCGVFGCFTSVLQKAEADKGNQEGHMKATPQTPLAIGCGLFRVAWFVGYSIYAIVLWASLGDSESGFKCSDLLTTGGDNEGFLILWKITACLYFIRSIVEIALLVMGILACMGGGSKSEKCALNQDVEVRGQYESTDVEVQKF